jgi:hypothetical protein
MDQEKKKSFDWLNPDLLCIWLDNGKRMEDAFYPDTVAIYQED